MDREKSVDKRTGLISLCRVHHELAEAGRISRATLHELAKEERDDS